MLVEPVLRPATAEDHAGILALGRASLGWKDDDRTAAFFRWKHLENPFGPSPMWVAVVDERVVAFRTFLRWRWRRPDSTVEAVRAVDTATHPDFQGRGLFRRLTLHGVEALVDDGVGFVFNTPNDNSRPGYLKMGWQEVGRPPIRFRPMTPAAPVRMLRARAAAALWSDRAGFGTPAVEAFADDDEVRSALRHDRSAGLTTDRSPAYLRWRFGFEPLQYRVVTRGDRLADGFAVVRLRRRGAAVEGTVCELAVPPNERRAERDLLDRVEGADYLLVAGEGRPGRGRFWPAPGQGPLLTWRALAEQHQPPLADWHLTLGDLELF